MHRFLVFCCCCCICCFVWAVWYLSRLVFSELMKLIVWYLSIILVTSQPLLLQQFLCPILSFWYCSYVCVSSPKFLGILTWFYFFLFLFQFGKFLLAYVQVHWFFFFWFCQVYLWVCWRYSLFLHFWLLILKKNFK